MNSIDKPVIERRITIGIAIISGLISIPLFALAGLLGFAILSHSDPRQGVLLTSFPLTLALFLAVVSWRGFASANIIGAAISPRGWRLLAAIFLALGLVVGFAHWFGIVLPAIVGFICLLGDPKVIAFLKRIGFA